MATSPRRGTWAARVAAVGWFRADVEGWIAVRPLRRETHEYRGLLDVLAVP